MEGIFQWGCQNEIWRRCEAARSWRRSCGDGLRNGLREAAFGAGEEEAGIGAVGREAVRGTMRRRAGRGAEGR